jgi:DNA-binding XRE family transcriptional regulator
MATAQLCDLKSVRQALGRSQSELAALLGVSTRAIQSYEQGWRPVPQHVQKSAALLLFLNWRKDMYALSPCWKVRQCVPAERENCPAYEFRAGELCWLITGTFCNGTKRDTWEAKIAHCRQCVVMTRWLDGRDIQPTQPPQAG